VKTSNPLAMQADPYRASAWLIAAYLIHLAEEWFGGFPEWSRVIRGAGVSSQEFIVINAIALALFVALSAITRRRPGMAWFPSILAAIFVINGILHALATWRYGVYSPGTVSGLLIYLPLGVLVLREMREYLSSNALIACLGLGAVAHVFITYVAFR
jgi:hypothetical protein